MEKEMRVLYVEGVAIHGGPEPCVGRPRGRRRSVGRGRAGWAIEPRNQWFGVPTLSQQAEGHVAGGAMRESSGDDGASDARHRGGGPALRSRRRAARSRQRALPKSRRMGRLWAGGGLELRGH